MHRPWGRWQRAPRLWPRACTSPTMELENAMPARVEPSASCSRRALSSGASSTLGRASAIFSTAIRARASLTGFLPLPMKASMAWVMASMAVAAVMGSGSPWVRRGSSTASWGSRKGEVKGTLRPLPSSRITATRVTSDPVPAVVGTAASGLRGRVRQPAPA
ncbi:hypothetical protein D3C85_774690 [compost metagenome]